MEFILLCNMMSDLVLHTSFNITAVAWSKNPKTFAFWLNYIASILALAIFIFEMCRFTRINYNFMLGALSNKYKLLKIKKFNRLKQLFSKKNKGKDAKESKDIKSQQDAVDLTATEKKMLDKDANDLTEKELELLDDITVEAETPGDIAQDGQDDDVVLGMVEDEDEELDQGSDTSSEEEPQTNASSNLNTSQSK